MRSSADWRSAVVPWISTRLRDGMTRSAPGRDRNPSAVLATVLAET